MNGEEKNGTVAGINRTASGKYQARIFADGKQKYLGSFETYKDAVNARLEAEAKYGKPSSRKIQHEIIGSKYPNSYLFVNSWGISGKRNQTIYHCTCECGNKIDVSYSQLKSGKIKSCGCVAAEPTDKTIGVFLQDDGKYLASIGVNNENIILGRFETFEEAKKSRLEAEVKYGIPTNRKIMYDIVGKKYPKTRLYIESWGIDKNNKTFYHCICECGNTMDLFFNQLETKGIQSCGCKQKEQAREIMKDENSPVRKITKLSRFNGTSAFKLNQKLSKNNTTGVKGVTKVKNRYRANITISNKKIFLGSFETLSEAARARKRAEEKYFKPIIDEYQRRLSQAEQSKHNKKA